MIKVITKLSKYKSILECSECSTHYEANNYDAKKSRIGHLCKQCKSTTDQPVDQALLKRFFLYDSATGSLTYRLPTHHNNIGDEVGYLHSGGYKSVFLSDKEYLIHRIIWMYVHGHFPEQIDHIDHNRTNNALSNLREVSNTTNSMNTSLSTNSSTKVNGVSFMKSKNKFRAYVMVNRKQIHLGLYDSIEEARERRALADTQYGFHTNHGNER